MSARLAVLALLLAPAMAFAQDQTPPADEVEEPAPASEPSAGAAAQARLAYAARDYEAARTHALAAARDGDAQSMTLLGVLYERGYGVAANDGEARRWYEQAAVKNQPDALVGLGRLALDGRASLAPTDARPWLARAVELGSREARLPLARMLAAGVGGPPDLARARDLFAREVDAGSVEAMIDLAHLDLLQGDEEGQLRARDLLERAARAGSAQGAYEAGVLWADDEDDPESLDRAAPLLKQAAEGGHANAATLYAHALWDGAGVEKDQPQAVRWYEQAAQRGDAEGEFYYALMLFAGAGVPADGERAYYWTVRSELADPQAETGYGELRDTLRARIESAMDEDALDAIRAEAEADHAVQAL